MGKPGAICCQELQRSANSSPVMCLNPEMHPYCALVTACRLRPWSETLSAQAAALEWTTRSTCC
jgi:hypothetical protein